ncbi:unnamed protein product [Lepidochelys olivacea]
MGPRACISGIVMPAKEGGEWDTGKQDSAASELWTCLLETNLNKHCIACTSDFWSSAFCPHDKNQRRRGKQTNKQRMGEGRKAQHGEWTDPRSDSRLHFMPTLTEDIHTAVQYVNPLRNLTFSLPRAMACYRNMTAVKNGGIFLLGAGIQPSK